MVSVVCLKLVASVPLYKNFYSFLKKHLVSCILNILYCSCLLKGGRRLGISIQTVFSTTVVVLLKDTDLHSLFIETIQEYN